MKWHILGTKKSERSLQTARIAGALTGKAWKILDDLPDDRKEEIVEQAEGCEKLLEFLKESLMDSAVPEAGRWVREYLYKFKRTKGESMKLYTARHQTLLGKLEKAMRLVETTRSKWWETIKDKIKERKSEENSAHEEEEDEEDEPNDEDLDDCFGPAKSDSSRKSKKSTTSKTSKSSVGS